MGAYRAEKKETGEGRMEDDEVECLGRVRHREKGSNDHEGGDECKEENTDREAND